MGVVKADVRRLDADTVHVVIGDTQVKPGVRTDNLRWIGWYVGEKYGGRKKVKLIHLMDHWDFPSLSSYDKKGGRKMEGRRYIKDVEAGNDGWHLLNDSIVEAAPRGWFPEAHGTLGNHEWRAQRAGDDDATVDGLVTLDDLACYQDERWQIHDFLEVVKLDGVMYSHYFANRGTGRPIGGQSIDARLKTVGGSFTMGHQQGLMLGRRDTPTGTHCGLVLGSSYLHNEDYLGHQGNRHFRGIVVCHDVRQGEYDPKVVSLNSLCKRYEGKTLAQYMGRH